MKKKKLLSVLVAAALGCSLFAAVPVVSQAAGTTGNPMYRLYNPNSGEHFYTKNSGEKDILASSGWTYEGIAWTAPASSNTPVYRVYNPNSGEHHYTTAKIEKDYLISLGWNDEGIGWYSDDSQGTPLYRLYNPGAVGQYAAGAHHYTKDVNERNILITAGWNDEGIGWYGCNEKSPEEPQIDPVKELRSVKIDKSSLKVGDYISATITPSDADGVTYKWEALDTANAKSGSNIGSKKSVQLSDDCAGKYIRVTATDSYGNSFTDSTSVPVEKLEPEQSPIVVNFPDLPFELTSYSTRGLAQLTSLTYEIIKEEYDGTYNIRVNYEGTIIRSNNTITSPIIFGYSLRSNGEIVDLGGIRNISSLNDGETFKDHVIFEYVPQGEYEFHCGTVGNW